MRVFAVFMLTSLLLACGTSPKDYSGAKELQTVVNKLRVMPVWVLKTGEVPDYAHVQLQPIVSGNAVFIANINGKISSHDMQNGNTLWSGDVNEKITGGPGVGNGQIFIGTRKAELISLSQQDGRELWRTKISSEMLSTPVYSGDSLYVQTIDGKISSINANTGKLNWVYTHDTPRLTLRGTASPVKVGAHIISGFADGKLVSLDSENGELLWSTPIVTPKGRTDLEKLSDIDGVLQVSGDTVYVIGYQGRVAAVSATDGSIQWSRTLSSFNGLTFGNDRIYISDDESKVWALDARTGATLWRQENLMGRELTTPEVINNTVVVADFDGYVHWLSEDDGRLLERQNLNEIWESYYPVYYDTLRDELKSQEYHRVVSARPLAVNNTLLVRDNDGDLVAFRVEG